MCCGHPLRPHVATTRLPPRCTPRLRPREPATEIPEVPSERWIDGDTSTAAAGPQNKRHFPAPDRRSAMDRRTRAGGQVGGGYVLPIQRRSHRMRAGGSGRPLRLKKVPASATLQNLRRAPAGEWLRLVIGQPPSVKRHPTSVECQPPSVEPIPPPIPSGPPSRHLVLKDGPGGVLPATHPMPPIGSTTAMSHYPFKSVCPCSPTNGGRAPQSSPGKWLH